MQIVIMQIVYIITITSCISHKTCIYRTISSFTNSQLIQHQYSYNKHRLYSNLIILARAVCHQQTIFYLNLEKPSFSVVPNSLNQLSNSCWSSQLFYSCPFISLVYTLLTCLTLKWIQNLLYKLNSLSLISMLKLS